MARAILELIGDPESLLKSFRKSSEAADMFGGHLKELAVTAEQSANAQIRAAVRRDARLRQEIATYRQVASAAKSGSREQIAAANLATRAEERLNREMGRTARAAATRAGAIGHSSKAERTLGRDVRGGIAGSGLLAGGGRLLAFGSLGFLASYSASRALRASVDAGTEAAAVERQLAAQFRASGMNIAAYRGEIDKATLATSALSGFTKDDLTSAFITAFRGSKNVTDSLKIQSVAADVARGRHIGLAQATLALTKAYGGQTTALRRLGVQVPKTLKGMDAISFVSSRFAGQAEAGTTSQERFAAALHNTEATIGLAILPTLDKYLGRLTKWLDNTQNQKKVQHDVNKTLGTGGKILHAFGLLAEGVIKPTEAVAHALDDVHKASLRLNKSLGAGFRRIYQASPHDLLGPPNPNAITGSRLSGNTADRQFGRSSGGAAAFAAIAAASTPLGFKARFAVAELGLAQAQLTKTQADDRKILKLEADLLRERIKTLGTGRKTLAERTTLTQQLVSVEGQITSIETDAANKVDAARKKRLTAEQKAAREAYRLRTLALRNEAQRLAAEKSADTKQLAALKQSDRALSSKIKTIQANFKSALATARQGIGDLFGGPVLNFSDEQRKAALGIPNPAADPKALVRDLRAQVRAESARQRNINRIQKRLGLKRGSQLITELRANTGDATEVAALAGADKGTLSSFAKQFAGRERLVQRIARADMHVQLLHLHVAQKQLREVRAQENHFTIYINDVEQKQAKVKVKQSAVQRRGPVPGRG